MNAVTILAIETSCDETSIAVMRKAGDQYSILSHVTLSQIDAHIPYGGVYPNLARREHQANITHVLAQALESAHMLQEISIPIDQTLIDELFVSLNREEVLGPILIDFLQTHAKPPIDTIAVTIGPGLEPALWVGINTARTLAMAWDIPVVPVNHMEGHIYSCWAPAYANTTADKSAIGESIIDSFAEPNVPLPSLALLISGGHTEFISVQNWGEYEYLGGTIDDAIGEAFDKSARLMGLAYPGGPKVSKLAAEFASTGETLDSQYDLPRPMIGSGDLRMSFSGLKTAVRYLIEKLKESNGGELTHHNIISLCYSFETSVIEIITKKTKLALDQTNAQSLMIGGGVAASNSIRSALQKVCDEYQIPLLLPTNELSTDNALMIALAGIHKTPTTDLSVLVAQGNMKF
jgi:N6-L-threonylcarbamoyladenine synthase